MGVSVLALVFAGVLSAAVRIREIAVIAQATARANTVMVSTVEELRSLDYDNLVTHLQQPANLQGTESAGSVAGVYPISWGIEPTPLDADYLRVRVRVNWTVGARAGELVSITDFYREGVNRL